jgi:hypothetical protein
VRVEHGVCHVALSLAVTERFVEQAAARSQTAATASMRAFFEPRVVAVVGANRERGKIGSELLNNLVVAGFSGTILPVHPGVANYLNNGEQSFFDEFQSYFYLAAAVLSVLGSIATLVIGRIRTGRMKQDLKRIGQFIDIADRARNADAATLDALDTSLHELVDVIVASGSRSGEESVMAMAVNHARYSVATRRAYLRNTAGLPSQPAGAG